MPLNIRNPETERLATELARRTGETKTEAVTTVVLDRVIGLGTLLVIVALVALRAAKATSVGSNVP